MVEQLFRKQMMSTKAAQSVRETDAFLIVVSRWSVKPSADQKITEQGFSPSTAGRYRFHYESTSRVPRLDPDRMLRELDWPRVADAICLSRG